MDNVINIVVTVGYSWLQLVTQRLQLHFESL